MIKTMKCLSRLILLLVLVGFIVAIGNAFGAVGVILLLLFGFLILIYIQIKGLKRTLDELNKKLDNNKS